MRHMGALAVLIRHKGPVVNLKRANDILANLFSVFLLQVSAIIPRNEKGVSPLFTGIKLVVAHDHAPRCHERNIDSLLQRWVSLLICFEHFACEFANCWVFDMCAM